MPGLVPIEELYAQNSAAQDSNSTRKRRIGKVIRITDSRSGDCRNGSCQIAVCYRFPPSAREKPPKAFRLRGHFTFKIFRTSV